MTKQTSTGTMTHAVQMMPSQRVKFSLISLIVFIGDVFGTQRCLHAWTITHSLPSRRVPSIGFHSAIAAPLKNMPVRIQNPQQIRLNVRVPYVIRTRAGVQRPVQIVVFTQFSLNVSAVGVSGTDQVHVVPRERLVDHYPYPKTVVQVIHTVTTTQGLQVHAFQKLTNVTTLEVHSHAHPNRIVTGTHLVWVPEKLVPY